MAPRTKKKRSRSRSRSREKPALKKGKNDIYVGYKNGSIEVNGNKIMKVNEFRDLSGTRAMRIPMVILQLPAKPSKKNWPDTDK